MSTKKLAAVEKALSENAEIATWYREEFGADIADFTVQNVREYGLGGKGELADEIILDAIKDGTLMTEDAIEL